MLTIKSNSEIRERIRKSKVNFIKELMDVIGGKNLSFRDAKYAVDMLAMGRDMELSVDVGFGVLNSLQEHGIEFFLT